MLLHFKIQSLFHEYLSGSAATPSLSHALSNTQLWTPFAQWNETFFEHYTTPLLEDITQPNSKQKTQYIITSLKSHKQS